MKRFPRSGAIALSGMLFAPGLAAQISADVSLVTDYRVRGMSLSRENPAAQLGVVYDHAGGEYAGAFLSNAQIGNETGREMQLLSYAGVAHRWSSGLSAEVGGEYSTFSRLHYYNYGEIYCGIASERLGGRIYYAPRKFGQISDEFYAELNGTRPWTDRVHFLSHLGILRLTDPAQRSAKVSLYRYDVLAGIAVVTESFSFQVAWVGVAGTKSGYPFTATQNRSTIVLSLSRSF